MGDGNYSILYTLEKTHRICDNRVDGFYCSFVESDCPVGGIVSDRSRNMEFSRQLCVNAYFIGIIQVLSELEFYTLFSVTVGKHIILNVSACPECLINTCVRLLNSEYSTVICTLDLVIWNVIMQWNK